MGKPTTLDLRALCTELAGGLDETDAQEQDGHTVYARGGVVFARVAERVLEVRLPPDIAEAALRTADTEPATEPGWVVFTPNGAEPHELDRAEAWFYTAWRHSGRT